MNKYQKDVEEFHKAMGQVAPDKPTLPSEETARLRAELIREEFEDELKPALGFGKSGYFYEEYQDLTKAADAIADLLYVVYGTANALGIDIEPVWDEVQKSNMSKFKDGYRREDGKWMKGPSYSPAKIEPILLDQGMKGNDLK